MAEAFAVDWLRLRAPYDAAARDAGLVDQLAAWAAGRGSLRIADLGAGSGSTWRQMAPRLGGAHEWTLVEWDEALIAAGPPGIPYRRLNLATDLEALGPADLITASALIDLVDAVWLRGLVELGTALYIALTIDGQLAWEPIDPKDELAARLVGRHQRTDKGFGPALGADAVPMLARLLGGSAHVASSDWRLGSEDGAIQAALLEGYAVAATAVEPALAGEIAAWAERRLEAIRASTSSLVVGHRDILWLPD